MTFIPLSTQKDHTLALILAGFVLQASSFHGWCNENTIDSHNARMALTGKWVGPRATALVTWIKAAARVAR